MNHPKLFADCLDFLCDNAVSLFDIWDCQSFRHSILQAHFHWITILFGGQHFDGCGCVLDDCAVHCEIFGAFSLLNTTYPLQIQSLNSWNTPGFWNEKLLNYPAFNLTMAVLDFVFDILILLLPLPVIFKLHMDRKRKYALIGIFWLGAM